MWHRPLLIILLATAIVYPAQAFERPFPQNAKRGSMTPAPFPELFMDGKSRQLAAGARIWNPDNLIEMPSSLRGSNLTVNYTENTQGEIDRVWILNAEEARQPLAKQLNPPR